MAAVAPTPVLSRCPYCKQPIGDEQVRQIRSAEEERLSALRAEAEQGLAEQVKARTAALEEAKVEAEQRAEGLQRDLHVAVAEQVRIKTLELETAKSEAERRAAKLQEDVEARVSQEVRVKTAEAEEARLQAERHVEALERDAQANLAETISTALAEKEEEIGLRVSSQVQAQIAELDRAVKERDQQLERALKTNETLQRQLDEKPSYTRGGVQESELIERLRLEFPSDRIQKVSGRSGADVEQEVFQSGQSCGTILYESKNVQNWNSDFIDKLNKDKVDCGASYAVLVTTAFPAKAREFTVIDGVAVVRPELVVSLASILRQALVDLKLLSLSQEERGSKLEQLMIYFNSPDFKNKMQNVLQAVDDLDELQLKERRAHERLWDDETVLHKMIRNSSSDIRGEISGIIVGR